MEVTLLFGMVIGLMVIGVPGCHQPRLVQYRRFDGLLGRLPCIGRTNPVFGL